MDVVNKCKNKIEKWNFEAKIWRDVEEQIELRVFLWELVEMREKRPIRELVERFEKKIQKKNDWQILLGDNKEKNCTALCFFVYPNTT